MVSFKKTENSVYNYLVKVDYDANCSEVNRLARGVTHTSFKMFERDTKRFLTIHILPRKIVFLGLGSPIDLLTKQ